MGRGPWTSEQREKFKHTMELKRKDTVVKNRVEKKARKKRVVRRKKRVVKEYPMDMVLYKVLVAVIDRRISMYLKERIT